MSLFTFVQLEGSHNSLSLKGKMCIGNRLLHSFLSYPKLTFCDVIRKSSHLVLQSKGALFETSWQVFVHFRVLKSANF